MTALKQGQIDGLVVDLPTADYVTNVQVDGATIVGQFEGGANPQYFSLASPEGQRADRLHQQRPGRPDRGGHPRQLASTWLPFQDAVPPFQP